MARDASQVTRLKLAEEWKLEEFASLSKHYAQLYSFFYAVDHIEQEGLLSDGRVERAFVAFPWRGGWSTVDFFDQLAFAIPQEDRLKVKEIKYSSPGHIDLWAIAVEAAKVAAIVTIVSSTINRVHSTYRNIQRGIREHKLGKIDVRRAELELEKEEKARFVDASVEELSKDLGFSPPELRRLNAMTPSPLGILKMLLALYRKARELSELQREGKIEFSEPTETERRARRRPKRR